MKGTMTDVIGAVAFTIAVIGLFCFAWWSVKDLLLWRILLNIIGE